MQEDELDIVQNRRERPERRSKTDRRAEKKPFESEDRRGNEDRRADSRRVLGQNPKA